MTYWQHEKPIKCPKGHKMIWLGSVYWLCERSKCATIYVQVKEEDANQNSK